MTSDDTTPAKEPVTRLCRGQDTTGNEDSSIFRGLANFFQTAVMVNCQVFTLKAIQLQVNICPGMSNAGGPMNLTESLGTPTPKGS